MKPELDLEELEQLAKAATPGPWVTDSDSLDNFPRTIFAGDNSRVSLAIKNNAAYIVAACNAVPELIAIAQYLALRCADMDATLGNEDAMTADEWLELAKLNAKGAGK